MNNNRFFCFTVDDNIRALKDITEREYKSIFDHPYLAMYKRLHERFGLKVQLNLFYECQGFDLRDMTDKYIDEWQKNSDWLKLSFHSKLENVAPYQNSEYAEVKQDCDNVHNEILRFAGENSLAKTTTVHYCVTTFDGLAALKDSGVCGLLGLFGNKDAPRTSYGIEEPQVSRIRQGEIVAIDGIAFSGIDIILNSFSKEQIVKILDGILGRDIIKVMIHEQYFYDDYFNYQPNFEDKLITTFQILKDNGYKSELFENII